MSIMLYFRFLSNQENYAVKLTRIPSTRYTQTSEQAAITIQHGLASVQVEVLRGFEEDQEESEKGRTRGMREDNPCPNVI